MTKFPKFKNHAEARCFKCAALLFGNTKPSGFGEMNGAYLKQCQCCGMSTWYDIKRAA